MLKCLIIWNGGSRFLKYTVLRSCHFNMCQQMVEGSWALTLAAGLFQKKDFGSRVAHRAFPVQQIGPDGDRAERRAKMNGCARRSVGDHLRLRERTPSLNRFEAHGWCLLSVLGRGHHHQIMLKCRSAWVTPHDIEALKNEHAAQKSLLTQKGLWIYLHEEHSWFTNIGRPSGSSMQVPSLHILMNLDSS